MPLQTGLEGMMEEHGYFIDIAFDMLLATSTHISELDSKVSGIKGGICYSDN